MGKLLYNKENDKAYRCVGVFGDIMHLKEVKINTGRAKMNAPTITVSFAEFCKMQLNPIHSVKEITMMKQLAKEFNERCKELPK